MRAGAGREYHDARVAAAAAELAAAELAFASALSSGAFTDGAEKEGLSEAVHHAYVAFETAKTDRARYITRRRARR